MTLDDFFQPLRLLIVSALISFASTGHAAEFGDKRDKPGEVQKLLVPRELIPSSAPRTAEEELKSFQIAPGFRIELVAGDPLVQDPVAMQIGPDGRMWVVEMRGFMADLDGVKEAEPVGDVAVLEDTDGDGRMDKRTVFQDGLIMPRALLLVGDGVLVGAPPQLWFCRDTNGDGKADEKKEIASNFGMQSDPVRPEVANPEQAPNSLLWANDNWIYAAHWTRKFRYDGGQWTNGVATFRGQWGLTQDNDGHFFYNSNQDPLRTDILPSHYTGRNPNHVPCGGVNVQVYTDQLVWPIRVNPGINRGYRDGILRENFRLKEFTAACAPCIYRGGLFPSEFDGNAFICEPAGNLIKREIITAKDGTLTCKEAYDQREFLTSTDERFRPVNLYTGPEGAFYVTDLYRGVLQHRESFTTYLRRYIEERGLDQPQHLGRIWRIVPDGKTPLIKTNLHRQTPAQWVEHLSHTNNWWRETAQRLLVERNDASVVPALQMLALKGKSSLGRVHAPWTLEGMGRLDPEMVLAALKDENARVRAAAVRVSETFLKNEHRAKVLPQLIAMTNEDAPFVQQQLVLTLSEASDKDADHAVAALVKHAASTAFIQDAALSGLAGRELALLDHLLSDKESQPSDQFLSALARCIFGSRNSTQVESLLELVVAHPEHAKTLTAGILETKALTGRKPVKFKTEPAALKQLNNSAIAALLTWPGKTGSKPEPPVIQLTAVQQTRHDLGKVLFNGICAGCHQPHGLGLEGVAPPLVDSEWVLGSEQRLVRILLHGITGPLSVKGRTYRLDMPAMGAFTDDQLSGILTYIRREWEHNAAPVEPETVKAIRSATADRHEAWLGEQLLEIDSAKSASATLAPRSIESTFHVEKLAKLDAVIEEAIRESKLVGAALWVEREGVAYHKAFGMRALTPKPEAMTEDTIFDIASITKVAATASAAMLCVERGMMSLDDPVSKHLGEFIGDGREKITIKHLLLHTSGLEVNLNGSKTPYSRSPAEAFAQACREKPMFEPGTAFSYSSVGSMVIGMVIERLTRRTLDSFCATEIFRPLKMRDTLFRSSGEILRRVAPSSAPERGQVDDFVARHMGGIAGHASLFTTTSDLARFARMMINRGELDGVRIFKPETINLMTSVQSPPDLRSPGAKNLPVRRALGWDIDTPYRTPPHDYTLSRGGLFPVGGYGHTGWTGQMLWIDPFSRTTVIFLCNRYGPKGKDTRPDVYQLHHRISTLAAEAVKNFDFNKVPGALAPARISQPNNTQP